MSRIYDALKEAQRRRPPRAGDRRRSARLLMELPLFVYGRTGDDRPFHEEARTVQINSSGGLLLLNASVQVGQELLLTNPRTQQEQRCQVVRVGAPHPRGARVGVAFAAPASDFWAVSFPNV